MSADWFYRIPEFEITIIHNVVTPFITYICTYKGLGHKTTSLISGVRHTPDCRVTTFYVYIIEIFQQNGSHNKVLGMIWDCRFLSTS